ncbi:MAG: IPT/TIG domain-containing protein [Planctomycetota bacterium]
MLNLTKRLTLIFTALSLPALALVVSGVPSDIQQPGTQPLEVPPLAPADSCLSCHGGYDQAVEPGYNWRGSMMAHAARDPVFWAALAVAEQDFSGVGDLCLRCHTPAGWLGGRSTPSDGSALLAGDANGVECDLCHRLVNPDNSEFIGVQNAPYLANDELTPAHGYYGSGMYVVWPSDEKLGPYASSDARHPYLGSLFHRSVDFCGTCHDVSNPLVGDVAPNNGAQTPLPPGSYHGSIGGPVEQKAAFNNFPYQYGVIERTYSEFKAGLLSQTLVSSYAALPSDLKAGAIQSAYESALVAGQGGNYEDGTPRYFSCQTCHMHPVTGHGCMNESRLRKDLPLHDLTGGNYWVPDALLYLDSLGKLRLGGGLTQSQQDAIADGKLRALGMLDSAASLEVIGNAVRVVNLTGHKLISGYPEGRRMWLHVKWYDLGGALVREDGAYGGLTVMLDGAPLNVDTLLDPDDPHTRIYETRYGLSQEFAADLIGIGLSASLPISFDRITGAVSATLGDLAAQPPGTSVETFHFALNNVIVKDTRIPPYGMSYDESVTRNLVPVPANQYGNPGPGGTYDYFDLVSLDPPANATFATIDLDYQPTSWEYIQFLYLANVRANAFLADEGVNLLAAWLNTGMAAPHTMATATWGCARPQVTACLPDHGPVAGGNTVTISGSGFTPASTVTFAGRPAVASYIDEHTLSVVVPAFLGPRPSRSARILVSVAVTTPDCGSGSLAQAYGYVPMQRP